jgi:hypothetical protein
MSNYRSLIRFVAVLGAACVPVFATIKQVTPEPSLAILTAVGVGALIVVAKKKRRR